MIGCLLKSPKDIAKFFYFALVLLWLKQDKPFNPPPVITISGGISIQSQPWVVYDIGQRYKDYTFFSYWALIGA